MRGLKLLSVSALAANKAAVDRQSVGMRSVEKPLTVDEAVYGRRKALQAILGVGAAAVIVPSPSVALDMDAFVNAELESDVKNCDPKRDPKCIPKLTPDEAQCKYGQSGNVRSEACKRVKEAGGALPSSKKEKSLGGAYAM